MTRAVDRGDEGEARTGALASLLLVTVGFALAAGAALGTAGLRTSGFTFTLTPRLSVQFAGIALLAYLVVGLVVMLLTMPARIRRSGGQSDRLLFASLSTVTLWVALTLTFLPLKGSEAFVKANALSTVRLNLIGLGVIFLAGIVIGWLLSLAYGVTMRVLRRRLSLRRRIAAGVSCAVLAIVVMLAGPYVNRRARASGFADGEALPRDIVTGGTPRVAIIGVDGCDWEKLGPLVEAGRLPTFRKLMDEGAYGGLTSMPPLVSPRIWTTIATGKIPEKHGILDFVNEQGVPVNATMRRALPIWDIVSGTGGTVGVVGWYVTWPAEDVGGFLVSDRFHTLVRGPVQVLQSATGRPTNARLESFGRFSFDPGYKRHHEDELAYQQNRIVDEPLRWGYLRDAVYTRLSTAFLPIYEPTFTAVYLRGVDFVQHFFWKYSDPEPFGDVTPADIDSYGEVIDNYYVYTDALLARLMKALGDDVNIMLVADHGFQPRTDLDPKRPQLTGTHDIEGVFIASGPAFRNAGRVDGATVLDVTPTALAVMGFPRADDMDGRVLTEIIEPRFLVDRSAESIPTYDPSVVPAPGEVGSTMDDSIKEQLKSLGYIE
jgi:predicted AlkP superfamily phosphohydrolase/phosphomutase